MEATEALQIIIWPLTLLLFLVFFMLLFRDQIREILKKVIFKFKKGDTEFELTQQIVEPQSELEKQVVSASTLLPVTQQDDNTKVLDSGPKSPDELMDEMRDAIFGGDFKKAEILYKQLQDAERDPVEKSRKEGIYYYYLYERGDTSALQKIAELAKNPDISHYAHHWLGLCYESSEDFERALTEHKLAVQESKSQEKRAVYVVSCARSLCKGGKKRDAFQYIMAEIASMSNTEAVSTLYKGLSYLYWLEENHELRGLALDKAIQQEPNNTHLLFDAAYSYSEANHNELSLLYYNTLLGFSPKNEFALNNIGVAYYRLGMPIKSISHHKKAADLNNTLAASNIASTYLQAGFADEATQVLEKAREQKNVDANVGSTFSKISDNKEKERKQEKDAFDRAREQQRFLRSFGKAYFVLVPEIVNISGTWCFSDGTEATITQQKESFRIEWTEHKQTYCLTGELVNRAAQVIFTEPSYRAKNEKGSKLYISPDCTTINLIIKSYSSFEYKTLTKKQNDAALTNTA
jgi:tetratricopeptide (TPR) repeat protein